MKQNISKMMQITGFFILHINRWISWMFVPIWSGPGKTDSINRLIQLSVIQLSGGYCIKVPSNQNLAKHNQYVSDLFNNCDFNLKLDCFCFVFSTSLYFHFDRFLNHTFTNNVVSFTVTENDLVNILLA